MTKNVIGAISFPKYMIEKIAEAIKLVIITAIIETYHLEFDPVVRFDIKRRELNVSSLSYFCG